MYRVRSLSGFRLREVSDHRPMKSLVLGEEEEENTRVHHVGLVLQMAE